MTEFTSDTPAGVDMIFADQNIFGPSEFSLMKNLPVLLFVICAATTAVADNSTLDAAIGGGIGGAAGAAIGNELGGRDAAILGGALGAAVGTAVNTADQPPRKSLPRAPSHHHAPAAGGHPRYRFCPPGQAKKGRC